MLAICVVDTPVVFKAPKTSSKAESVSQDTNPRAKPGHKKLLTSSKQPFMSSKEATKGGSSKAPTSSKTDHSKKRKEFSSTMDSNPSQPPVSTPVDTGMHKEDQQATGGPTSLGVTSEAIANPQLSSGMSIFNLNEPIYSASFIIHSESASGNDASAASTTEDDPEKFAPSTDPHVLADQIKSISEGLETVFTQPKIGKGASSITRQVEEEASNTIKLKDLEKLVDEDEEDEGHTTTEDTSSQKHKLEIEKNKAEAEVALLKDQPSFPNMGQLNELLVLDSASSKAGDQSIPSTGQANTMPVEGEKNTNQATISQLFQRRAEKNVEKENLNNQ
ncbi:hypothetical protein Tco_1415411 [Tanacetum coccineum]